MESSKFWSLRPHCLAYTLIIWLVILFPKYLDECVEIIFNLISFYIRRVLFNEMVVQDAPKLWRLHITYSILLL